MGEIISMLKTKLSDEELEALSKELFSSYNLFDLTRNSWDKLFSIFPADCHEYIKIFQKTHLPNEIYNDVIFNYYKGENIVKYNLLTEYLQNEDEVVMFETNVNSSRLDFLRVNGKSYAYEIKTELDTTDRLIKQFKDYEQVFEYIYVVIHPIHLKKVKQLIPRKCGIITYVIESGKCIFNKERDANLNKGLKKEAQIKNLNSEDYAFILKSKGISNLPNYKDDREILLKRLFKKDEINELFKMALKNKNKKKWEHVKKHIDMLLPIDIQDFFTSTLNPNIVYHKSSSIDFM